MILNGSFKRTSHNQCSLTGSTHFSGFKLVNSMYQLSILDDEYYLSNIPKALPIFIFCVNLCLFVSYTLLMRSWKGRNSCSCIYKPANYNTQAHYDFKW